MKKLFSLLAATCILGLPTVSMASVRITGCLSNFDCWNDDNDDSEGLEIEIEDCSKDDVYHTYAGSFFGGPKNIYNTTGPHGRPSVVIRYFDPARHLPMGGMTHFGVSLRKPVPAGSITYRWIHMFGGQEVQIDVEMPTHTQELMEVNGEMVIRDTITNTSWWKTFWVKVHEQEIPRAVSLEELMNDNPVVTDAPEIADWEELGPGQSVFNDITVPTADDEDATIFWYDVHKNTWVGGEAAPGAKIGTIMDSTNTSQTPPTMVSGHITLNDFMGAPTGQPLIFELIQGGTIVSSPTSTLDASGNFSIQTAWAGSTVIKVKAGHWLSKTIGTFDLNGTAITNANATLINGDIDFDNAVTVFDYGVLSDYFDKTSGDSDWTTIGGNGYAPADADLDGDGAVTVFDYGILSDHFDQIGE